MAEHVRAFCAPSSNAVGVMRRQARSGDFEECQALVLPDVVEAFDSFQNHHPEVQISLRQFRQFLPWYVQAPAEVACAGQPCVTVRRRMPCPCETAYLETLDDKLASLGPPRRRCRRDTDALAARPADRRASDRW